jgi:hypothetical protein
MMQVTVTIMHLPEQIARLSSKQKLTTRIFTSSTSWTGQRPQCSPPSTEATALDESFLPRWEQWTQTEKKEEKDENAACQSTSLLFQWQRMER